MVTVYPRADKCSAVAQPQYPSPPVRGSYHVSDCWHMPRVRLVGRDISVKHDKALFGSPMTMTRGFPPPAPFELLVGTS